ncbi:homeobox protein Dlx1a isoform X3 [Siniperca chuatsi]|uniref:homeobox protein Dlx1a isoform X3 n=1 Tax=Siniperca chuatsi TaxID=119488 RepID=UPI001CE133CB|nr:homeobox protein Dlx1a isoform X3 [Siniperca chuatsi]
MRIRGQYIMTLDYVTTGIVSDWADHIEIKDEDLIQRQLQVFFCCMASLCPVIFKKFPSIRLYSEQRDHTQTDRCILRRISDPGWRGFICFFFITRFLKFFGPSPSVANRLPSWREWTNQRQSLMNIHESEIQTFERVCLGPQHHT